MDKSEINQHLLNKVEEALSTAFKSSGENAHCVVFSPGRINLIGEHIDYCGGLVMPAAIQYGTYVAAEINGTSRIRAASCNQAGVVDFAISDLQRDQKAPWGDYIKGVIAEYVKLGVAVPGLNLSIGGDIPGGGLSSSASLEVAIAVVVEHFTGFRSSSDEIDNKKAMSWLSQRAENQFVGMNCGIMDQGAVALGRNGHAMLMDCRDLSIEHVPTDLSSGVHRRYNPLLKQWVLVSPHRSTRPWQGEKSTSSVPASVAHDKDCYLCAGNKRANGHVNPDYRNVFVFDNDFAALVPRSGESASRVKNGLLVSEAASGTCRVICFSPRHDLTLPELDRDEICDVIDTWSEQYAELRQAYAWVQIFENKGAQMGCSNPHPHGQIWASEHLPSEPSLVDLSQREHYEQNRTPLLMDYLAQELVVGTRVVEQNEHWCMLVPYWAAWPFELLLLPKQHIPHMGELKPQQKLNLADILKRTLTRYDNLFEVSFPYSMGWHQAPGLTCCDEHTMRYWQLHAHFYPPLLRSADVKKFMVGYEMLADVQRDISPEEAARRLRKVSATQHYKQGARS